MDKLCAVIVVLGSNRQEVESKVTEYSSDLKAMHRHGGTHTFSSGGMISLGVYRDHIEYDDYPQGYQETEHCRIVKSVLPLLTGGNPDFSDTNEEEIPNVTLEKLIECWNKFGFMIR